MDRAGEVDPPGREADQQPAAGDRQQFPQRPVLVQRRLDGDGRGRDRLTEHDQGEQPVALGDVLGVPGGAPAALRVHRHAQLGGDQQQDHRQPGPVRQEEQHHPADLDGGDAPGVAQRHHPLLALVARGDPQPLDDQGAAHHQIAEHAHGEVPLEQLGDAGRQDQRPGDLHQGGDPVGDVVGVVGGGEPGEVHPGPPDGEEGEEVAADPRAPVALGQRVRQMAAGLGDGDHEAEVEEQLQRGGGPVCLVPAPGQHPPHRTLTPRVHVRVHVRVRPLAHLRVPFRSPRLEPVSRAPRAPLGYLRFGRSGVGHIATPAVACAGRASYHR